MSLPPLTRPPYPLQISPSQRQCAALASMNATPVTVSSSSWWPLNMMARKASFGYRSRGQSNARPADHRPATTLSPKTRPVAAAEKSFVEFHPSMSLENAPTVTDCLGCSSGSTPSLDEGVRDYREANAARSVQGRRPCSTKTSTAPPPVQYPSNRL